MASSNPAPGLLHFSSSLTNASGEPYTQAGGHPYQFSTNFHFETFSTITGPGGEWNERGAAPFHDPKNIVADLPSGLVVNPRSSPHCSLADYFSQECEYNKVSVGDASLQVLGLSEGGFHAPIVNLDPAGAYPGELGVPVFGIPIIVITTGIRTGEGYGILATSLGAEVDLDQVRLNLWGVPADEGHNSLRGLEGGPPESPPTPFVTTPTECSGNPLVVGGSYDTWDIPGEYAEASVELPPIEGCNALSFEPTIEARPTTILADAPSGFEFHLNLPQNEEFEGVASAELKEAVLNLPEGLTVNPSIAKGLMGCTEAQVGLHSQAPAACPDASTIGSAEVHTPLLPQPLKGFVYLAAPHQNPSGSLLAAYLVVEGEGVWIKLPGNIQPNAQTGRLSVKFAENPQLPFENLQVDLFGGALGALRTSPVCGTFEVGSTITPFSAPESGPPATPKTSFNTDTAAHEGEACPTSAGAELNAPRLRAGTETPQAGTYSPFTLRLVREDGSQEVSGVETSLPKGLVGRLAGIPYCSDAAIAAAANKSGAEEKASSSCPAASEVGTVDVASGAGPTPINIPGHVYLAGPYKGAPLSVAIVTPALAGPFDLGTVVVRAALYVNPETAQVTARSDEIPHILQGIPLDVRSVTMKLSHPNFTLNPTNCEESSFTGVATSVLGQVAPLTQRFQVGGCAALPFAPKLTFRISGSTKHTGTPALTATLSTKPGEANVASTSITLPHSEFLEQAHLKSPCPKQVFAEGSALGEKCPSASIYGYAKAVSPLVEKPLEGPVYLRTAPGRHFPDLVVALNGQIDIALAGHVESVPGQLRTSFETVPDAPISRFTLTLDGGHKGLIANSTNLCAAAQHVNVQMAGQNGNSIAQPAAQGPLCQGLKAPQEQPPQASCAQRYAG